MRKQITLKLNPQITVTVLELTPRDVKHALSLMKNGDIDFMKLLTEDWDDALAKLSGVIRADKGDLLDVSFSEIDEIQAAFLEVNQAFFNKLKALGLSLGVAGPSSNIDWTELVLPSSKEDTPEPATTAGNSS
jgi:hypothetical protein